MDGIDYIKSKVERLYTEYRNIHISVRCSHPKTVIDELPVKIVGVYKNIFQVESINDERLHERLTYRYSDVLIGHVKISELDFAPTDITFNKK